MAHISTSWVGGDLLAVDPQWIGALDVETTADRERPNDFERLVRLVRDNERLRADLEATRARARRAWAYLTEPASNPALALAQLEHLRQKRSAILAQLRANLIEARELLGGEAPGAGPAWSGEEMN